MNNKAKQWQLFTNMIYLRFCVDGIPPDVLIIGEEPIHEADQAHHSSEEQHFRVEAQPGKVDADFLPIVFPVMGNKVL